MKAADTRQPCENGGYSVRAHPLELDDRQPRTSGAQGWIIDVALCGAAEVGVVVCLVHRCIGLQPHNEVRIGQDHLAIGFEIGQPRGHVGADLVARTTRPAIGARACEYRPATARCPGA